MRGYWGQPSLSRDFALLSAAVLFLLLLISAWVTYSTYTKNSERIAEDLGKEAARIERTLASEMDSANHMLLALGKQIAIDQARDLVRIAQMLKSFDSKGYIYAVFTLVSPDEKIVVSSNRGVLDVPVDASDRDYVKRAFAEPWKMHIGRPVEGHVSNRWVVPVAMGLTDYTGKFVGTVVISIDINTLTEQISTLVKRDGISFGIISKTLIALTQVSEDKDFVTNNFPAKKLMDVNFAANPSGLLAHGSLFWGTGNYAYYRVSSEYPYIILLGYDPHYSDENVRNILWSRLLQMLMIAVFFVLFLWIMRTRMVKPVLEMTTVATSVAKGDTNITLPKAGAIEIESLATQIRRICEYIDENMRVENELRNKIQMLRRARQEAEMANRSKSELLGCICQEMQVRLSSLITAAQMLSDQSHGQLGSPKYQEAASDIYNTSNTLFSEIRDTLSILKIEAGYTKLAEKPVELSTIISKTLRFIADKTQALKLHVKVDLNEPMPRLLADDIRIQQVFMNLLLHLFTYAKENSTLSINGSVISEKRDKQCMVITLSTNENSPYQQEELAQIVSKMIDAPPNHLLASRHIDFANEDIDIGLELAKTLVALHKGYFNLHQHNGVTTVVLVFPASRIRFMDSI
jgi:signal transduction histidine kinase